MLHRLYYFPLSLSLCKQRCVFTTARSRNESGNVPDDSDLVSNAVTTSCDPTELTLNMLRNHALKKPKKQEIKKTHTEYLARKYGHQPLRRPYSRRESCNKIAQCSRNITSPCYPHENLLHYFRLNFSVHTRFLCDCK